MYWLEVSVITDGEGAEAVAEVLRPFAYQGSIAVEQLGDEDNANPNAMETAVTVKIYIAHTQDTPALRRRIEEILYHMGRMYPIPPPTFRKLEDKDWAEAWKEHYHPFRIGHKIWIQPSWIGLDERNSSGDSIQEGDVVLVLDPGMAFGTGTHPTTQMCLQALEKIVKPGDSLFDVGTGSAILAIAAAKLGATPLLGIDIDQVAIDAAIANAEMNGVADGIVFETGVLTDVPVQKWNIVVVNILAPIIISLLDNDRLMDYVADDGYLILSGIVDSQMALVETAVTNAGGVVEERLLIRDWVSYVIRRA